MLSFFDIYYKNIDLFLKMKQKYNLNCIINEKNKKRAIKQSGGK